jgi:hypothetical protein
MTYLAIYLAALGYPISFWSITVCTLGLGGFLLVFGIHDLLSRG